MSPFYCNAIHNSFIFLKAFHPPQCHIFFYPAFCPLPSFNLLSNIPLLRSIFHFPLSFPRSALFLEHTYHLEVHLYVPFKDLCDRSEDHLNTPLCFNDCLMLHFIHSCLFIVTQNISDCVHFKLSHISAKDLK